MHRAPHRLHDEGCQQIAGNCGARVDAEQQHEDRRHEGAAAHAREPHGETDEEAGGGFQDVEVHFSPPMKLRCLVNLVEVLYQQGRECSDYAAPCNPKMRAALPPTMAARSAGGMAPIMSSMVFRE